MSSVLYEKLEAELQILRKLAEVLNKSNNDLKNKLVALEHFTLELDWDQEIPLITGTYCQPSLQKILSMGSEYCKYFGNAFREINAQLKNVEFTSEKEMKQLENAFCQINMNIEGNEIGYVIALTQYVDNTKDIT